MISREDLDFKLLLLNNLLFIDPKNQNGLRQRAYIYKEFLEFDKAEDDLLLAIQIDKFNFLNNKTLVEFYTDHKKYQKALTYCDLMIENNIEADFFLTKKVLCKMNLGFWSGLKNDLEMFNDSLEPNNLSLNPLSLKYLKLPTQYLAIFVINLLLLKIEIKILSS